MKTIVLLIGVLAVASAEWIEIDWSQVRPIEDFDHYWARLPSELQFFRKAFPNRRITNGKEATPGQFPYHVALLSSFDTGTGLCGGSVLTGNYILTAAHCVYNAFGGIAILGAHNRLTVEAHQQRIGFMQIGIHIHPGYNPNSMRNDIATVRLDSPMTYTDRVRRTNLPALSIDDTFEGVIGTVSGFGRTTDTNLTNSAVLMFTTNPIMSNEDCWTRWGGHTELIQEQNICLSGDDGRSPCNGDSGGPLTVEKGGFTMQVGIASFGSAAGCTNGMPSVFVRTTYYLDWIAENSDFIPDD